MKKLLSLLILPIIAMFCFTGCKDDITSTNINDLYNSMKAKYVVEEINNMFCNEEKPNTITINYSGNLYNSVYDEDPQTDMQKRYVVLNLQQKILNYLFNFYEVYQTEFYALAQTIEIDKKEYESIYNSLKALDTQLEDFNAEYKLFVQDVNDDKATPFSIINYTYYVNKVIDKSFDFIYNFINTYERHLVDTSVVNTKSVEFLINKSYVDIARVVYIENFKAFNSSVGEKGVCDLIAIVDNNSAFNLIKKLDNPRAISASVKSALDAGNLDETISADINNFIYKKDVFNQRVYAYYQVVDVVDMYTLNQYRFNLVAGTDYESYKSTLSVSNRANVEMIEEFVSNYYMDYFNTIEKLTV